MNYLKEYLMREGNALLVEILALAIMVGIIYLLGIADWMRKKGEINDPQR